jgi:hypothetical protein
VPFGRSALAPRLPSCITSRLDAPLPGPPQEPIQVDVKPVRNLKKPVNVQLSQSREFYSYELFGAMPIESKSFSTVVPLALQAS